MVTVGRILDETFRFIGRNIRPIGVWMLLYILFTVVQQIALPQATSDMPLSQAVTIRIGRYLLALAVSSILYAAVFRAAFSPQEQDGFYLRLGADEARLFGLTIGAVLAFALAAGMAALVIGLLAALLGALVVLLVIALLIGTIYGLVRLSPAWPLTVASHRLALDEGWALSRGRFWVLFGAYLVVFLIIAVAGFLLVSIEMGSVVWDLFDPRDPEAQARVAAFRASMDHQSIAVRALWGALGGVVAGLILPLHMGVVACAARLMLAEQAPPSVEAGHGPWNDAA